LEGFVYQLDPLAWSEIVSVHSHPCEIKIDLENSEGQALYTAKVGYDKDSVFQLNEWFTGRSTLSVSEKRSVLLLQPVAALVSSRARRGGWYIGSPLAKSYSSTFREWTRQPDEWEEDVLERWKKTEPALISPLLVASDSHSGDLYSKLSIKVPLKVPKETFRTLEKVRCTVQPIRKVLFE
jgi:hypothetical protein